jgi:hypothetical protein
LIFPGVSGFNPAVTRRNYGRLLDYFHNNATATDEKLQNLFIGQRNKPSTTRKNLIRGVQNLPSRGVQLYATGKTPLVQGYPWRTACTSRLNHPPVAYRSVRHGYDTYQWRTCLYATDVFCIRGVQACMPRVYIAAVAYGPVCH